MRGCTWRRNEDLTDLIGTPVDMQTADGLLDHYGTTIGGKSRYERNLITRAQEIQREVEEQYRSALKQTVTELLEREQRLVSGLGEVSRSIRDTVAELEVGRLDARSARQRLAKAEEQRQTLLARLDQLRRDDEAADALAEQGPTEWQADLLRKYPALRSGLPQITPADLHRA